MLRKILIALFSVCALLTVGQAQAAVRDTVTEVSSCGNSVLIHMQTNGWYYVSVSGVGAAQAQAIANIALVLMQTGHQTRFFYATPTVTLVCGVNARQMLDIGFNDPDRT